MIILVLSCRMVNHWVTHQCAFNTVVFALGDGQVDLQKRKLGQNLHSRICLRFNNTCKGFIIFWFSILGFQLWAKMEDIILMD